MYNEQHQLTRAGAEQIIRNGGSVLLKDKAGKPFAPVTKVEDLPDETWFANSHRVTRGQAEAAIKSNGAFTFNGETFNSIEDLPSQADFDKVHKANLDDAKSALKARRDALDKQIAAVDKNLDDLTVAELHERAKTLGLSGYSDLHKDELLREIKKEEKKQGAAGGGAG